MSQLHLKNKSCARPARACVITFVVLEGAVPYIFKAILDLGPHSWPEPKRLADGKTKSTILEFRFTLTKTPKEGSMSIYSTYLYRGVIIPI